MKKLNKAREIYILKMFGHPMGKFHLMMNQETRVCFTINPGLVGNGQGLHYGKEIPLIFMFIFGFT